jgi:predicted RNA methylase
MLKNLVELSTNEGLGGSVTELRRKLRETAINPPWGAVAWGIRARSA